MLHLIRGVQAQLWAIAYQSMFSIYMLLWFRCSYQLGFHLHVVWYQLLVLCLSFQFMCTFFTSTLPPIHKQCVYKVSQNVTFVITFIPRKWIESISQVLNIFTSIISDHLTTITLVTNYESFNLNQKWLQLYGELVEYF